MADGVAITAGSGTTIATDDAGAAGHVQIVKLALSADGSATAVTADAGGLLVNLGTNNDVTVTGTVTADAGTNLNTSALALEAGGNLATVAGAVSGSEMQVDVVAALPAGTNAIGKLAANSGVDIGDVDVLSVIPGTGATSLGKAVDSVGGATDTGIAPLAVRDDALDTLTPIEGDYVNLRVDANGALWTHDDALDAAISGSELQVDVVAALPAGDNNIGNVDVLTIAAGDNNIGNVDIVSVPAPLSTTGGGTEATALRVTVATDSTGVLSVDDNGGNLSVDWGGTAPPIGAGVEATALRVTVATDSTGVLSIDDNAGSLTVDGGVTAVGTVADDGTTPGAPVMVGGFAISPDGTDPGNVSAEADVARFRTDLNRRLLVNTASPFHWSYHENSSSALTDASVKADPGDGFAIFVTDIVVSTGAATAFNIFFEEATTTVLGPYYLEAVAGRGFAVHFNTPKMVTASTALTVTTSAAIAHSIDVTGYVAAV